MGTMMTTFRSFCAGAAACAILPAVTASAAEPPAAPRFTLEDSLRIGRAQSSAIVKAREDVKIAETRIRQVRALILPHLSANGGYTRLDEVSVFDFDGERVEMGRLDNYSAGAEVSQLLYSGGSVRAGLKAARVYREMAQHQLDRVSNELVRDIRVGFHRILLAQAAVKVQEESVAQLQDLVRQAESRVERGTAPEFDLLSARVRLANEEPALIRARRDVELAKASFRDLLQLKETDFELDGELDYRPDSRTLESWQAAGRRERPELLYQKLVLELTRLDIRAERGTLQPQVRAHATYEGLNPESGTAEDAWDWGWNAGVSVEWELFDGGLRRGVILQKNLELMKSREDLDILERAVDLEIRQNYLELVTADKTVAAGRETVSLAKKSLEIARTRYKTGLSTYLEYTDAQLALSTARLTWLTALCEHKNSLARLACASGAGLDNPKEENP